MPWCVYEKKPGYFQLEMKLLQEIAADLPNRLTRKQAGADQLGDLPRLMLGDSCAPQLVQ